MRKGTVIPRPLTAALTGMLVLGIGGSASAHPPYEYTHRVVQTPAGGTQHLVMSFVDGIIFYDPVKLVVRDEQGRSLAETPYGRNIAVVCASPGTCVVFRYSGFLPVGPSDVWWLRGSSLLELHSPLLWLLGVVAPLFDEWVSYLVAIILFLCPFVATGFVRVCFPRSDAVYWVAAAGALFLLPWGGCIVLYTPLSPPLLGFLIACLVGPGAPALGLFLVTRLRARLGAGGAAAQQLDAADEARASSARGRGPRS